MQFARIVIRDQNVPIFEKRVLLDSITVPATILRHFTLKASDTSALAEANAHSDDWLMHIIVNELAPPHARSQPGKCVQQCRRILAYTIRGV